MPESTDKPAARRGVKYHKARVRNFLFTHGPNRLSGGRLADRHLSKRIEVREVEVFSPNWPADFDGMRIGHVSDFHLGDLLPVRTAIDIVKLLADQKPDFVACTGDVVDLQVQGVDPLLKAMADIEAPLGKGLVLGNHDELHCATTLTRKAERAGLPVLRNERIEINRNGANLTVAGVGWARKLPDCSRNVDIACGGGADLLLSHNPKSFRRAAQIGVPLTLAGHTHGGQVAIKNRPNANLAVGHRQSAGLFLKDDSRLFVTTGVGAWFPLRVNCPPEIAVITMRHHDT